MTEFTAQTFGKRFRTARLNLSMTQMQVARVLNVRENDIRRWESGRNLPNPTRFPDIAAVLNVSIDWLFGIGEGNGTDGSDGDSPHRRRRPEDQRTGESPPTDTPKRRRTDRRRRRAA